MTKETLKSNGMVKGGYLKDCKKFQYGEFICKILQKLQIFMGKTR